MIFISEGYARTAERHIKPAHKACRTRCGTPAMPTEYSSAMRERFACCAALSAGGGACVSMCGSADPPGQVAEAGGGRGYFKVIHSHG